MKTNIYNFLLSVGLNIVLLILLVSSSKDLNAFYTSILCLIFLSQGVLTYYILSLREKVSKLTAEKPTMINHRLFK